MVSVQRASEVACKAMNVHSVLINQDKVVTAALKADITTIAQETTAVRRLVVSILATITKAMRCKAVTNPVCKAVTIALNKEVIVPVIRTILTINKVVISLVLRADMAVLRVDIITIEEVITIIVEAMDSLVATTTEAVMETIAVDMVAHNREVTTTIEAIITTEEAMIRMQSIVLRRELNTKRHI